MGGDELGKAAGRAPAATTGSADLGLAAAKSAVSKSLVLDPNTAARDDLLQLPGVGEKMANRIIEARPYKMLDDMMEVPGIGRKTLEKLKPHLAISTAASRRRPK